MQDLSARHLAANLRLSPRLLLVSHPRSEGETDQESIGILKPAHRLAPRFLLVLDKHSIPHRLELRGGTLDTLYIELEPGVGHGQMIWPGAVTETGFGRLRERPKSECL